MMSSPTQKNFSVKKIRFRIIAVGLSFLLLFALIAARGFELNLTDNSKLKTLAEKQYTHKVVVAPKRGNILDTHGDTLAIDIQVDSIYAIPNAIEDPQTFAKTLAPILKIPADKILERVADNKKKFVWLKRRVESQESDQIKKLGLAGIGTLPEYKRHYPNGSLAANLLGAVGYDAMALSGLEMAYDETLKSVDPPLLVEQDAKGRSYAPYALMGLEHPNEVVLTLDKTIQYVAERELKTAVDKAQAQGGVAIVLDVKTGEVLAMATQPTFDPNEYYKYDVRQWRNRPVTDVFEPGSIFKAFTASAALETKVFDLKKTLYCENGSMQVGKFTIHDHHPYGSLNLSDIIKYSSNICSYKLAQMVGKNRFYDFVRAFGFGQKTEVGVPGEVSGIMASLNNLGVLQLGTMAFGQGISVTPIQIASGYAAIANGGLLMKPYLIKEIRDSEGKTLKQFEPQILRRVLSEATAREVARLLETVVEEGGTGTKAALQAYRVAGKTGTAQKVMEGAKGYAKNKYIASFSGFAPSRDPRLVVLVSIDEPKGDYYGGAVSAPVFREIMGQSLAYLKVAPDTTLVAKEAHEKKPEKTLSQEEKQNNPKIKDKSKEKNIELAEDTLPEESVTGEPPNNEAELHDNSVPDFRGLSVREAMRRAQSKNYKLEIRGSGICNRQEPQAGNPMIAGASIVLECQPPI
jgi:cell division protein FtsI (penicillin-binding protein 3)